MSQAQRIALVLAAVVVLGGGFLLARGGGGDTSGPAASASSSVSSTVKQPGATPAVLVRGGRPSGGVKKLEFAKGAQVRFTVTSDVADEIHVHGYDLKQDVTKGGTVTFTFKASIDGIFEVELEKAGVQIAELKVDP